MFSGNSESLGAVLNTSTRQRGMLGSPKRGHCQQAEVPPQATTQLGLDGTLQQP